MHRGRAGDDAAAGSVGVCRAAGRLLPTHWDHMESTLSPQVSASAWEQLKRSNLERLKHQIKNPVYHLQKKVTELCTSGLLQSAVALSQTTRLQITRFSVLWSPNSSRCTWPVTKHSDSCVKCDTVHAPPPGHVSGVPQRAIPRKFLRSYTVDTSLSCLSCLSLSTFYGPQVLLRVDRQSAPRHS